MSSVSSEAVAQGAQEGEIARKRALRRAFGAFATGVTVVTARDGQGRPIGFTANSFTSVSLDPPLVLVCPGKGSSNIGTFRSAPHFAVNILAADQQAISHRFATPVSDRFAGLAWQAGEGGVPLIDGAAAWFACARHDIVEAGDHLILIGRVAAFDAGGAAPLVFAQGGYRELAPLPSGGGLRVGIVALREGRVLLRRGRDDGWELPLGPARPLFLQARSACEGELAAAGAGVTITHPYSIYDDGETGESRLFFIAELDPAAVLPPGLALFAPDELPILQIRDPGMRDVLLRHGHERRHGRFGVYVARDRAPGSVSQMTGVSERWNDVFRPDSFQTEGLQR